MNFKDLFPTPENIINQMCFMFDMFGKNVLEPHAGTGNIVSYCNKQGANLYFCEIEPKLQRTIKDADFIKSDFLKVESSEVSHIDFIVMNPPFSQDIRHILHAWNIAPPGCEIVSLCNTSTLGGHYSKIDEINVIIENHGNSESLGDVFKTAERQTNVDVSMVKLYKPAKEGENEFEGYLDMNEEPDNRQNGIIKHDWLAELVNRYIGAVKQFSQVSELSESINELTKPFASFDIKFGAHVNHGNNYRDITRIRFKKDLQKAAWQTIFRKMNMEKYTNKKLMDTLNKFIENNSNVPFTVKNIYKIIDIIYKTHGGRMNQIIVDVFDRITKHYKCNREAVEGWKTNNQYYVGKKFIFDYTGIRVGYQGQPEALYMNDGFILDDFTKALCYMTAKNYDDFEGIKYFFQCKKRDTGLGRQTEYEYKKFGKWYDFGFFKIKVYKKGSMHCQFKDEKVRELFNRTVAKAKGWRLPSRTGEDFRRKKDGVELF